MQTGIIALLGLASLFIGWILTLVLPGIRYFTWGILLLGVFLIAVAFVIDYRRVRGALVSRRGKFSTGTTLMVSIFVGIILLVNAISYTNFHRWDVTGLSQYTLTSQTKEALANLDQEIEVIKFFVPNDSTGGSKYASSLLDEYQNYTDKLNVKLVDPDEHPDQARKYGIDQYQAAFFNAFGISPQIVAFISESGQRFVGLEQIITEAEHAFTSAILEVSGTVQKKLYFITGHNESSIYDTSSQGYSDAREGLIDNLYQVALLDLLLYDGIPGDADGLVLVAPSPEIPLSPREVEIIKDYLDNGGRAIILTNPDSPTEINEIISSWGIVAKSGTIIDPTSYTAPNITSPSVPRTRNLLGLSTIYFPGATAIKASLEGYLPANIGTEDNPQIAWVSDEKTIVISTLAYTSNDSWLENSGINTEPQFDEGVDDKGPLFLGFIITSVFLYESSDQQVVAEPTGTVLVVIGDSDFASNKHFFNGNNSDFFLNSVEYLTAGTELISIDRKYLQSRRLIIGPEAERFITISSIGLLPLLVLFAGTYIWWRRR